MTKPKSNKRSFTDRDKPKDTMKSTRKKENTSGVEKSTFRRHNSGTEQTKLHLNNTYSDKKQDKIQPKKIQKINPLKKNLQKKLHPEVIDMKTALKQLKIGEEHAKRNVRTLRKKIDLLLKKENLTKKEKRILFNLKIRCKKVIRLKTTDKIEIPLERAVHSQPSFVPNKSTKLDHDKLFIPSSQASSSKKNKLTHIAKSQLKENLSNEVNSEHGDTHKLKVKNTIEKSAKALMSGVTNTSKDISDKSINTTEYTFNQSNTSLLGSIKQKNNTGFLKMEHKSTGQLKKQVEFPVNLTIKKSSLDGESRSQELSKTKKKLKVVKTKVKPFEGTLQLEIPNDPTPIQNKLEVNYLHSDLLSIGSPTDSTLESNELTTIKSINKILKKLKSTEDVQIQETIRLIETHINTKVGKLLRKLLKRIIDANDELK
ncbi:uncharacterized protein [Diabrotica undecimpunctata]|uniref:uncharacterized protein isoform X1 n=1 Tax=Diabrotica undecimpunctata TaxID=50387 RepID=UPI003B6373CD